MVEDMRRMLWRKGLTSAQNMNFELKWKLVTSIRNNKDKTKLDDVAIRMLKKQVTVEVVSNEYCV